MNHRSHADNHEFHTRFVLPKPLLTPAFTQAGRLPPAPAMGDKTIISLTALFSLILLMARTRQMTFFLTH